MLIAQAIRKLEEHKERIITQVEIAGILGSSTVSLNRRIKNEGELKSSELVKLMNHYKFNLLKEDLQNVNFSEFYRKFDQVEIKYIQIPNISEDIIKSPFIKESLQFDRELVENAWQRIPENQRIIKMRGNKMKTGLYPLRNNDILMVDISQTNIADSGIYLYTTEINGDLEVFINNVNKRPDGDVRMSYYNKSYDDIIYTPQELNAMKFKVIARVVKNLSLTI